MIFTPLISPAVTPLDTQFQYPEYPVPGEYFSPLTSPALEAQKHANHRSVYETIQRSDTSDTTSPVDMNVDFSAPVATSTPAVRKSKRKTASTSKSANRTVRQSPSMKPQSRKTKSASAIIPPKEISGVIEGAQVAKRLARTNSAKGGKLGLPYTQDSSEAGSISPEPLSEILMPPPATPRSSSSSASPYLIAKQSGALTAPVVALSGEPATPASLMKIRKEAAQEVNGHGLPANVREKGSSKEKETQEAMNNVIFPESASAPTKPVLAPLNTSGTNDEQTTPTVSARKDLKPAPLSAPATATKPTFLASPQIYGMTSPVSSVSAKRTDTKGVGRDSRKRNSNSSVHVSPALRPKMSPSIKPLLPEGGKNSGPFDIAHDASLTLTTAIVNAETSALLLASKSNYQNILEGTHLPGVSYPEALSTNLTSKRTSHKIAEQGRRNRINTALQEIASLLPPPKPASHGTMGPQSNENGPDNGTSATPHHIMSGTAAQQSNSKASTVEMAIEYIKSLQSELHDVKGKLDCAEKKLASTGVGVEP